LPFALSGVSFRVFAKSGCRAVPCESTRHPLLDLRPPPESSRLRAAGASTSNPQAGPRLVHRHPPVRSLAPSASPRTRQRLFDWPGLPHRTTCASRFSQPPGAFIRPVPGGLVSCHIRSWGCALQSLAPLVQPCAVSGAVALLSLKANPCPTPRAQSTAEAEHHTLHLATLTTEVDRHLPPDVLRPKSMNTRRPATAGRSHLQPRGFRSRPGSALAYRALLHTRVRHPPPAV
jgi:hypothetical protein